MLNSVSTETQAADLFQHAVGLLNEAPDVAILLLEQCHALAPTNSAPLQHLARLYSEAGRQNDRQAALDRLVELFDAGLPSAGPPQGLRDVALAAVSAAEIAEAVLADGAILLRGLLDPAAQRYFADLADQRWLRDPQVIFAPLAPLLIEAMTLMLGRPPNAHIAASNVREAMAGDPQRRLLFHQDLTPLCIMGINLWATLDPCDGTRPGFEMLAVRQHRAWPVIGGDRTDIPPYHIDEALLRQHFPASAFHVPDLAPGDGFLFLFSTIHATHTTPHMTRTRRNAELRFL